MNSINPTVLGSRAGVISDWAQTIARGARQSLSRLDHTLSMAELKFARLQEMRARRKAAQ